MRSLSGILIILAFFLAISSSNAQRVLLVEKPGKFKNFKYSIGNNIVVKIAPYGEKQEGTIHVITDTSLVLNFDNEIMLDDIEMILKPRWGLKLLSKITRIAGAGYFLLDVVNNTITGNPTIVDQNTLIISAGMVAFSYALVPFHNRRMKAGDSWRISVLDFSLDGEAPNPFR
jgi:hypothetical protein